VTETAALELKEFASRFLLPAARSDWRSVEGWELEAGRWKLL